MSPCQRYHRRCDLSCCNTPTYTHNASEMQHSTTVADTHFVRAKNAIAAATKSNKTATGAIITTPPQLQHLSLP
eukprot:456769-Ditylum_brightwellii.AAC.1